MSKLLLAVSSPQEVWLRTEAERLGISVSELMRRALDAYRERNIMTGTLFAGGLQIPIDLVTEHAGSCYRQPVLRVAGGAKAYGPGDLHRIAPDRPGKREISLHGQVSDEYRAYLLGLGWPLRHASQAAHDQSVEETAAALADLRRAHDEAVRSGEVDG